MTDEKYQELLNTKKFNRICFAKDYIDQILKLQKEVTIEDYGSSMSKLYSDAFLDGQNSILEKYSSLMLEDLKKSYEL